MSRRHQADKREVMPDAKFDNIIVTKFVNSMMKDGKRSVAEGIFYGALDDIKKNSGQNPVEVFQQALDNIKPQVEVRSRRRWQFAGLSRTRAVATKKACAHA